MKLIYLQYKNIKVLASSAEINAKFIEKIDNF